jgi:hypothetical protein
MFSTQSLLFSPSFDNLNFWNPYLQLISLAIKLGEEEKEGVHGK